MRLRVSKKTGFFLGLLTLALLFGFIYRWQLRWLVFALEHDYPPRTFVTVRSLIDKAERTKELSREEFATLMQYADHYHPFIRMRVLTALFYLRETEHASAARKLARAKLDDGEWLVRFYALGALYRLGDPQIEDIARRMAKDPAPRVRERALMILEARSQSP